MYKYRRVVISVIALLLIVSLLAGLIVIIANAKTSAEIQAEIDDLNEQSNALAEQREELEVEIAQNQTETLSIVERKSQVDREIELTRQEVELVNEQLHQYNLLIAERQAELDELKIQQQELFDRYELRMRAMQERGEISYWSVFFEAENFADMLNCRAMIEEIAKADQRMMDEMRQISAQVLEAKDVLAAEKVTLEEKKLELAEAEALLAEKRAESDALLVELNAQRAELIEQAEEYEAAEEALSWQIASLEAELTEVLRAEWEAAHPPVDDSDGDGDVDEDDDVVYPGNGESFLYPLPPGAVITSPYGYRIHPITGNYSLHNGVDLAIAEGTPIYATKSGYVTTATYNYVYGNYVTINHMDGFSSLYGHMTHFTVGDGQYVNRGDVIGYVGSTGWSTGPHLHFTIYYNGATVNPMDYVSLQ